MATKVTVTSGQTLSGIAKANNTTVKAILNANPVLAQRQAAGTTVLFNGTKVTIPTATTTTTVAPAIAQNPVNNKSMMTPDAPIAEYTGATLTPGTGPLSVDAPITGGTTTTTTPVNDLQAAKDRILADTLKSYGLEGIDKVIGQIRSDFPEINQTDLLTLLKDDPKYNSLYNQRFAGNVKRKAAGLQPLNDADYLAAEKQYEKVFKAYGVDSLANRDYYATLIGNKMDAQDVADRIDMGYQVYKNNPNVKNAFNQFYGTVTDGDVVAAMLDPETQIPLLQKKIRVAEIGGAALAQNLKTSLVSAQDLEAYGVTQAQAQAGYSVVAQKTPRGGFLSQISPELGIDYTQQTAENIQFKKSAADIAKEQRLTGTEIARFGGSAGRLASKDRAQGII